MEHNGLATSNDNREGKSFVHKSKILLARKSTKVGCFVETEDVSKAADSSRIPFSQFTIVEPCSFASNSLENSNGIEHNLEVEPNLKILENLDIKSNIATSVVAKIYDGTPISHPSPTTVHNKKRIRPKSAIEHQNNRLGLCCSLSERSLSPVILPAISTETNNTTGVLIRPLGIPSGSRSLDKPEIIERGEAAIISFKESSFSSSSPLISNSGSTLIKVSPKTFHSKSNVSNSDSSCARMRKRLLSRRSADNLVSDLSHSPLQHSSPESTRSVPIDKTRSSSHDTLSHRGSASMDSLARQALLAAQVLHLIPTAKARERNFLQGRIAANSLLGPTELERVLPKREVRVFVGTWNMNGQTPPKELNDFVLPSNMTHVPDILAVGTQESCSERFEWEVCLQETIGPTHVLLHSASLGTLHLAIFIRRDLVWFCSLPEDGSMSVRTGTAFRTKGAVAVAFSLFGTTYLFVTAHLTAHQEKVKERVQDIKRIIRALDLPKNLPIRHKNKDVTQNFDCVFWCGDLNFRLGEPRDKVLQWINSTTFPLPSHLPHGYMHSDQLAAVLADGAAFKGFQEAQITFPPTYKYDPGTQRFDTSSKQRAPAYTDRILYKSRPVLGGGHGLRRNSGTPASIERPQLECLAYDSVPSLITSDHKPVWALFKNIVRPGIDTIPLAAGLFNREVYLEGVKRRAATLELSRGASGVCTLQ